MKNRDFGEKAEKSKKHEICQKNTKKWSKMAIFRFYGGQPLVTKYDGFWGLPS